MKPDAETIIARALHLKDNGTPTTWDRMSNTARTGYVASAKVILDDLRKGGYSLIYGADHKFVKGE